jgi:hypothetical protein
MPHVKTVELPTVFNDGYTARYPSQLNSLLAEVATSVPHVEVIVLHCVRRMYSEATHVDSAGPLHFPQLRLFRCTIKKSKRPEEPMMRRLRIALQQLVPALEEAGIFRWSHAESTWHRINHLP